MAISRLCLCFDSFYPERWTKDTYFYPKTKTFFSLHSASPLGERDKSRHLKSACLHLDYNTFCQRTKGVQGLTAGDGGMRETPCSPASVLTLLWRCGFEFTASSISTLDSPQIGGVKADLNPDALHWCFHFSLLETDKLPGSCKRCYFWGVRYLNKDDVLSSKQLWKRQAFSAKLLTWKMRGENDGNDSRLSTVNVQNSSRSSSCS